MADPSDVDHKDTSGSSKSRPGPAPLIAYSNASLLTAIGLAHGRCVTLLGLIDGKPTIKGFSYVTVNSRSVLKIASQGGAGGVSTTTSVIDDPRTPIVAGAAAASAAAALRARQGYQYGHQLAVAAAPKLTAIKIPSFNVIEVVKNEPSADVLNKLRVLQRIAPIDDFFNDKLDYTA